MSHWKVLLLPLAVLLPLLAYVVGTLSTGQERPEQPEPVILRNDDPGGSPTSRDDGPTRGDGQRPGPRGDGVGRGNDDDDGESRDNGRDDDDVEDDPEVVLPSPTRLDDGETDDDDGDAEGDSDDEGGDD
ncbi:hypothetical protein [Nocardioides sp. GXQ0305]|uniref:hypothetical protein n=1 Tax=Nocardioides sp. GXQ0305 TaxID=3423912 RepID=UPI003D7C7F46